MSKHSQFVVLLSACAALVVALDAPTAAGAEQSVAKQDPKYVGAKTCKNCHVEQYSTWQPSHHSWAMRKANLDNVLGDFDDAVFDHHGLRTRFFTKDGKYFVETDGPEGRLEAFEIKYTVGVAPLQQYLVELEGGRLQALDVVWDVTTKRWFNLYPDQDLKAGNGLHWTGPYKNWNARCGVCHSTDYRKAYEPRAKTYKTTWSDINVACEACHGPGEAHVHWAKDKEGYEGDKFRGVGADGLIATFEAADAEKEIQICATCHSRRQAVSPNSPPIGAPFDDHYRLALLRPGLYHADGQILDEVYVHGSFLQSKMYAKGVRCTNCHEPHSGTLRAEGNGVCTQCHSPAGNADFASLKPRDYDSSSHHFHEPGTEGAQCVSCHMPARNYMVVDPRRDHSFRVPRPDLTQAIGTPNACTGCHDDKPASWATEEIKKRYPEGRIGTPHFATLFHQARSQAGGGMIVKELMDLALNTEQPAIVRATALDLLRGRVSGDSLKRIKPLQGDKNSIVRGAAAALADGAPRNDRVAHAIPFLRDKSRAVRLTAIPQVLDATRSDLRQDDLQAIASVMQEHQRALMANADFPETQMSIAGLALVLRNLPAAEKALRTAVAMDPQLGDAWLLLARVQMQARRPREAKATLRSAIAKLGGSAVLYQSLGNVLAVLRDVEGAERALKDALRLAPNDANIFLDLAALYSRALRPDDAIDQLEQLLKATPDHPQALELLALNQLAAGKLVDARDTVRRLMTRYPSYRLNRRLAPLRNLPQ